ncbi:cytochrome P450 [Streptomyces prunicolor]|uniref:cytochrome P450 family protein n=1 Tax=Streptomyces prunicolor TaxID=67348 RepID=UPI002255C08B|nr:cytochrome P450 [Streptomyces prunicolor]MCX5239062.1 cytochrome P450 [Streptomyces prunicolor]
MTTTQPPATGCPYPLDPTGSDIHGEAAALRALGPATRVLLPGGVPAWSVTDPDLIRRLLLHPDISKDAHQHWPAYINGEIPDTWVFRPWVDVVNALTAYGTEHTRLRRPLAAAFSPRRVKVLIPQIDAITHALLDDLQTAGPDEVVDLRARFAWRLPLLVADIMLGAPEELHDPFRDAIGLLFATNLSPDAAKAAPGRVYELIAKLIDYKRRTPGKDVTSGLITAHDEGSLTEQELADSLLLLIGAGHETTVNLLDNGIVNLITHPDQLALATTGEISWALVVEEILRHQAPIATIPARFAVREVVDRPTGLVFAQGDVIVINYAAAGRDPQHHDNADAFDVTREGARDHLAFGYGTHLCVGSELARTEGRIALAALFARFPTLRLATDPGSLNPLASFVSNGHQRLPVILGRAA